LILNSRVGALIQLKVVIYAADLLKLDLLLLLPKVLLKDVQTILIGEDLLDELITVHLQAFALETGTHCLVGRQLLSSDESLFTKDLAFSK